MNIPAVSISDASSLPLMLEPDDSKRLANLCGQFGQHLRQIEQRLNIVIQHRGNQFTLSGARHVIETAAQLLRQLYKGTAETELTPDEVHLALQTSGIEELMDQVNHSDTEISEDADQSSEGGSVIIKTKKVTIKPRGLNQQRYVRSVRNNDINFGIGPAGTGKTYLAVACAVEALLKDEIERILLVRPAVEAGEKLGFLPGDLTQKVDPYLRPLYDALYEMLGFEPVGKLIERGIIEIAPLAFMRGRTLNNSFVILDESQNTTREQMKMFLTRIGFGTTAVITGDPTQIDLPRGQASGLRHAIEVLDQVKGISFTHFTSRDVVRHPLVQRIVEAYEHFEKTAESKD
ncbi:PhoH family protein [Cellvibrio polysaccharolyticus]|uniref:PhoH-like protein n=1 Tax=Cellvibrio polysaccharolyticus TaxID=2082724 RepID=A0A928YVB9_9GAMM|nr:PhoH family protein [Cellvibrio polysaccharolyticus]MBE8716908.1 PhoH family protein [Cellvibrio polysaccharolyticus]